jgi:hypothetical protein
MYFLATVAIVAEIAAIGDSYAAAAPRASEKAMPEPQNVQMPPQSIIDVVKSQPAVIRPLLYIREGSDFVVRPTVSVRPGIAAPLRGKPVRMTPGITRRAQDSRGWQRVSSSSTPEPLTAQEQAGLRALEKQLINEEGGISRFGVRLDSHERATLATGANALPGRIDYFEKIPQGVVRMSTTDVLSDGTTVVGSHVFGEVWEAKSSTLRNWSRIE